VLVPNGDKHLGQSKSTTLRGVMVKGWPRPKASEDAGTILYRSRSRRHEGLGAASRRDEESASPPRYPQGRKAQPRNPNTEPGTHQETGRISPSLGLHRSARLPPSLNWKRFGDRGPLLRMGAASRQCEASGSSRVARCNGSPRRIVVNVQRVKPKARARIRASERSRARVSFIVLQKSKSCVWHRGSASTAKSGAGVHGCLGRCRSLRPTNGARVAVEGRQGDVSWRQNHGTLPARSRGTERGFAGAASGFGPRSRESSL